MTAQRTEPPRSARRLHLFNKRVVVEHPVVADGEHLTDASRQAVACQTPPEYLICTHHERNPPGLSPAPNGYGVAERRTMQVTVGSRLIGGLSCTLSSGQGWRMRSRPRCSTATAPARLSGSARLAKSPIALRTVAADWSARRRITMPAWLPGG
jgi:hypothetical protein